MNSKIFTKTSISAPEVRIQSRCLAVLSVFCAFVVVDSKICSSMNEVMNRLKKSNGVTSSEGKFRLRKPILHRDRSICRRRRLNRI